MKNLEKEYKAEISNEAPDLWSRIEAGVDAYEASKKETAPEAPTQVSGGKTVKFDSKRIINIIGKISVAALIFLVVAVTFNMTRGVRKDAAPAATETAQMADSNAAEAKAEEATSPSFEPLPIPETEDSSQVVEAPIADAEPILNEHDSKDAENSLGVDDIPSYSPTTGAQESSSETDRYEGAVTNGDVVEIIGCLPVEAIRFLADMSRLGFYPMYDLKIVEPSVEELTIGDTTLAGEGPYSIASFKAGKKPTEFLLYYRMDDSTAIDILAIKEAGDTKDFLYTKQDK